MTSQKSYELQGSVIMSAILYAMLQVIYMSVEYLLLIND